MSSAHSLVTFKLQQSHMITPWATQLLSSSARIKNMKQKNNWKALIQHKDCGGDEKQKEQSGKKEPRKLRVREAKGEGRFKKEGEATESIAEEWPRRMRIRKGHQVYNCISSFFMSTKQQIQKGSTGLKRARKKVNLMPEEAKEC